MLRLRPGAADAPRYVRMRYDVTTYGMRGRGELLVDRVRGRYAQRMRAGPVAEGEGFDGIRAWRSDATGMPRVQGNADERGAIVAWSYVLAGAPHALRRASVAAGPGKRGVRFRGAALSRDVDVVVDARTGLVDRVVRRIGEGSDVAAFSDYRTAGDAIVPFAISDRNDSGTSIVRVRTVDFPASVDGAAFAPPPEPHDFTLAGTTSLKMPPGSRGVSVPVRINGAPPLRLGLDTGALNLISRAAARRLGLRITGGATAVGVGAEGAAASFTFARSVRVGAAEMRNQPFVVLDLPSGFDGLVGYELLARFAVRIDFLRGRVDLARDASAFGRGGIVVPIAFKDKQPQADGVIDGIPAVLTLDTGSDGPVDVRTPFVRAHHLVERYHARVSGLAFAGVGGAVRASFAMARTVRIGRATMHDVPLRLADAKGGAEINPSVAANVGDEVFRRFVVVFDYRHATMRLLPGGDPRPLPWRDHSGLRLARDGNRVRVADVLTATPASSAGIRPGEFITAVDGLAVKGADVKRIAGTLDGAPGMVVRLTLGDGRRIAVRLRDYMPSRASVRP